MAEIIQNNPRDDGGSGLGLVAGLLIAVIIVVIIFMFVLPNMRSTPNTTNIYNSPGASPTVTVTVSPIYTSGPNNQNNIDIEVPILSVSPTSSPDSTPRSSP